MTKKKITTEITTTKLTTKSTKANPLANGKAAITKLQPVKYIGTAPQINTGHAHPYLICTSGMAKWSAFYNSFLYYPDNSKENYRVRVENLKFTTQKQ